MTLIERIKNEFKNANILYKIIYINICVFLIFNIFILVFSNNELAMGIERLLLPSNTEILITQPWSMFTYMFFHKTFVHLLFNMMGLYYAGNLFLKYFTKKQFFSTFLLGGIFGGLLFILFFNYVPFFETLDSNKITLQGASAGVMAIIFAIATHIPKYYILITFFGRVQIKYIAFILITFEIIGIISNENLGGHIAHIGGAIFGYIYITQLTHGIDISKNLFKLINIISLNNIYVRKSKRKENHQAKIDSILEKISKSGYSSLNKKEKAMLFNASKENK